MNCSGEQPIHFHWELGIGRSILQYKVVMPTTTITRLEVDEEQDTSMMKHFKPEDIYFPDVILLTPFLTPPPPGES